MQNTCFRYTVICHKSVELDSYVSRMDRKRKASQELKIILKEVD